MVPAVISQRRKTTLCTLRSSSSYGGMRVRGLLDRGEVLEARDLVEPLLLGLGEHGLLDEHRLGNAAASRERRFGQAQDSVQSMPLITAPRNIPTSSR